MHENHISGFHIFSVIALFLYFVFIFFSGLYLEMYNLYQPETSNVDKSHWGEVLFQNNNNKITSQVLVIALIYFCT